MIILTKDVNFFVRTPSVIISLWHFHSCILLFYFFKRAQWNICCGATWEKDHFVSIVSLYFISYAFFYTFNYIIGRFSGPPGQWKPQDRANTSVFFFIWASEEGRSEDKTQWTFDSFLNILFILLMLFW